MIALLLFSNSCSTPVFEGPYNLIQNIFNFIFLISNEQFMLYYSNLKIIDLYSSFIFTA